MKPYLGWRQAPARLQKLFIRHVLWRFTPPRYIILLGAPGSGKGTLAEKLAPALGLTHLSTGNLFRAEISTGTDLGKLVEPYLRSGDLVPDELTFDILRRKLDTWEFRAGAVLDGFPRTERQAILLERLLGNCGQRVELVFNLEVDEADLLERLTGRRICSKPGCGKSYHLLFNAPAKRDTCDACQSALIQRQDDSPEVVRARLSKYSHTAGPLIEFFESRAGYKVISSGNHETPAGVLARAVALAKH